MSRSLRLGGIVAGLVLILFGAGAVLIGLSGRSEVATSITREQIVGSDDMKPSLIAATANEAGLKNVTLPTCDVAGKAITNGGEAKCFASYLRIHALASTGGLTYAELPKFATADGKGTDTAAAAVKDPTGKPQSNPARQTWITATSLNTALNTAFFASSVATFAIVMGLALLLIGAGFLVLASGLIRSAGVRRPAGMPRGVAPAAG